MAYSERMIFSVEPFFSGQARVRKKVPPQTPPQKVLDRATPQTKSSFPVELATKKVILTTAPYLVDAPIR